MSASDIKVGGVYIELGAKPEKALAAIKSAVGTMKTYIFASLAKDMVGLGDKIIQPFKDSARVFAEYGEHISKIATKTGFSVDSLAGLAYAAKLSNVNVNALAGGVKALRKNGMNADDFLPAVDAISKISDANERASASMKIFGRAGLELLPLIEQGSAEIMRMTEEARTLGLVLGDEASENAEKLSAAFKRMDGATEALKLHIGAALAPMLTEASNRMVDVVVAARAWIDQNPEFIENLAKTGVVLAAVGTTLLTVAAAAAALMSPTVMLTAAFTAVGGALLAVTDITGLTSTGFGDLFNSIRVGGTGLGTWFATFAVWIEKLWNNVTANIHYSWSRVWLALKTIGYSFSDFFLGMIQKMISGIVAVNNALPSSLRFDLSGAEEFAKGIGSERSGRDAELNRDRFATDQILGQRDSKNASLDKNMQGMFGADAQDNTSGVHLDTSRARASLGKIGNGIFDSLAGGVGSLLSNVPHLDFGKIANAGGEGGFGGGGGPHISSVGSFSGFAGGAIAATGIFNQQLQEHKKTNQHLEQVVRNTGGSFGGFGLAG